jgi:predicted metal-dependent HD superfamily phosphohydrolase
MRDEWLDLCSGFGVSDEAAQRAFDRLAAAYASPGRAYHTLDHIREVLRTLAPFREQLRNGEAVLFAAWLHDAVYDPRAKDNEERSADLAEAMLSDLGVSPDQTAEVRRLILLTKTHDPEDVDNDGCLLVDADLAILGATPEEYRRYAAAIREEYAWVPGEAYRSGRRAVLEHFLQRPRIYRTAAFAVREEPAREHLRAEIQTL